MDTHIQIGCPNAKLRFHLVGRLERVLTPMWFYLLYTIIARYPRIRKHLLRILVCFATLAGVYHIKEPTKGDITPSRFWPAFTPRRGGL
jgi:hypothetical protein